MRNKRTGVVFAVVLAAMMAVSGSLWAQAAKSIKVRAGVSEGYARIVFDWPNPPKYRANIADGKLVIVFEQPFEAGFQAIKKHLYRYIGTTTQSADKRTVTMALLKPVRLVSKKVDKVLAFDLIDQAAAANSPAAQQAVKPVKPVEKVAVRAGEHRRYSRLVVDWRRSVGYKVSRSGDEVTLRFDRPADLNLASVRRKLPRHIRAIRAENDAKATRLVVKTPASVRFRHFRSGTGVVIDLLGDAKAAPPAKIAAKKPVGKKTTPGNADTQPATVGGDKKPKQRPTNLLARRTDENAKPPAKNNQRQPAAVGASSPAQSTALPSGQTPSGSSDLQAADRGTVTVKSAGRNNFTRAVPSTAIVSNDGKVKVATWTDAQDLIISFVWNKPVEAAVFRRGRYLWLIFEQAGSVDVRKLDAEGGIVFADQIENHDATVLRLRTREDWRPQVRRNDATWTVVLSKEPPTVETELRGLVQVDKGDKGKPRVLVSTADTGTSRVLFDPEAGDEIYVVPVLGSGAGVPTRQNFVNFQLLPTAQGVVVRPKREDLKVQPLRNGIEMTSSHGIFVSPEAIHGLKTPDPKKLAFRASLKRPLLKLAKWRGEIDEYHIIRRELQRVLAQAPKSGRSIARMELAKFNLAHRLAADATALLEISGQENTNLLRDPLFLLARGSAYTLLGRPEKAKDDLLNPRLKLYPDAAAMRGSMYLQLEKYADAAREFAHASGWIATLPPDFKRRFTLDWAVAAANGGSESDYRVAADALNNLTPDAKIVATQKYLKGRRAEELEQFETAITLYEEAAAAEYRHIRAWATMRKIDVMVKMEKIKAEEAIEDLAKLHYVWRGDNFELEVVARMVEQHLRIEHYSPALGLLRTAVSNFPENEITGVMAKQMNDLFLDLFLREKADELPAVTALALYYEFQELTPLGRDGDTMIQQLADRLVNVDLLGRAAKLLQHQVQYRLRGRNRARVATRLAVVYLLDGKAIEAIEALRKSEVANLPAGLAVERKYLHGRALAELGRSDEALALLADDDTGAAELLRADIYWRDQRWPEAARTMSGLLGQRWRQDDELSDTEKKQVIQLAVSFFMAGDPDSLKQVREQYSGKMDKGPMADTFQVLTHNVDPSTTEFRKLASEIARVADLETFMTSYRNRVKKDGLSALN